MCVPDQVPDILKAFLPTLPICKSLLLLFATTTKPCECYEECSAVLDDTIPMMILAVQWATPLPPLEVLGQAESPWAARQGGCRMGGRPPEMNLTCGCWFCNTTCREKRRVPQTKPQMGDLDQHSDRKITFDWPIPPIRTWKPWVKKSWLIFMAEDRRQLSSPHFGMKVAMNITDMWSFFLVIVVYPIRSGIRQMDFE